MSPAPRPNSRRNRRHAPKRSTRVICFRGPLGLGANLALGVRDVSQEGACLILNEALPVGQSVEINLESLHHRRPVKVPGVVAWTRQEEGRILVGVRFDRAIPYADLHSLAQIG